jgi:hypothetical protein
VRSGEKRCILLAMFNSTRSLLLAVLFSFSAGCDNEVREGHVFSGFNYTWDQLSHRVALSRAIMNEDGSFELGMIGGDWSTGGSFTDDPFYRLRAQSISAQGFAVVHGETTLIVTGPDGAATTSASITDATVAGMRDQIVVLRGFEIDTDIAQGPEYPEEYDPALGYTSRGFGFGVTEPEVDGDTLSFDVSAAVRWGPQDREDVNAAIPYAETSVVVAWTAIGFRGSVEVESVSASVELEHDPPFSEHDPIGEGELNLSASDAAVEIVGLQSFDLRMDEQSGSDEGGYLRSFGFEVIQDASGVASYAQAECSNSSVSEELGIITTVSGDIARIQLKDKDASVSISLLEGTHSVGDAYAEAK